HYLYGSQRFIEEYYNVKIPTNLNQKKLLQGIVPQFQEWVEQAFKGNHDYTKFILHSLYMANPHLVNFEEHYDKDELRLIAQQEVGIRKKFIEDIHENKRLARETIRASVMAASAKKLETLTEETFSKLDSLIESQGVEEKDVSNVYSSLIKLASRQKTEKVSPIKSKYEALIDTFKENKGNSKLLRNWQFAKLSYTLLLEENVTNIEDSFREVYQSYGTTDPKTRTQTLSSDLELLLKNMPAHSVQTKVGKTMHKRVESAEYEDAWK
ncbi:MAG TPA: hypothetical protein VMW10_06825, partial [Alphaproteobacteria bacterium]|nr:hypothetical protein [Alphaproteobacteria bacterium]